MSEAAKNRRSFSMAYLLAQCGPVVSFPEKQPTAYNAGLYETGTDNLIYSWDQLLGDEILEGGVVHVTDGVLTTNNANLTNTSSDILTGDLVIPEGITTLGDSCFYYCGNLTGVTIPEGVTLIDHMAFYRCESLAKINIPRSVKNIGGENENENGRTFSYCTALKEVYITDLVAWLSIDFADGGANPLSTNTSLYLNGDPVTDLVIPDGITEIKPYIFFASAITSVHIPDSVTTIGANAFFGSTITSVHIPDSVTTIKYGAFSACSNLNAVTGCANVSSVDGTAFQGIPIIYSDDQGLNFLHDWLIYSSTSAVEIDIPEGVTLIANGAISVWCFDLKSVTIPSTMRIIGTNAFSGIKIENITFKGTVEQWHSIELGENWNINFLATNVICSDGTVALSPSIE